MPVIRLSQRAMACRWEFLIAAVDAHVLPGSILQRAEAAFAEIHRQEHRLSVYRDDSLVSWLNRRAADPDTAGRPIRVDAEMAALLAECHRLWRITDGAFDVAVHRLIATWGFHRGPPRRPSEVELVEARGVSGTAHVRLDPAARTVSFAVPGVALNFGSIGKGYALDRAADVLTRAGLRSFLLHAGQSSLVACGVPECAVPAQNLSVHARKPSRDSDGWWVGVSDPRDPSRRLGRVRLRHAALSTSGSAYRFFIHDGQRYGHTLDPRTGRSAIGTLSATVIAPTAAEADALSTALFVMGPSRAVEFCARHPRIKAVIFPEPTEPSNPAGSLPPPILCGLSPNDWQLCPLADSERDIWPRASFCSNMTEAEAPEPEPDASFP